MPIPQGLSLEIVAISAVVAAGFEAAILEIYASSRKGTGRFFQAFSINSLSPPRTVLKAALHVGF
jgi:hypothetical protein